MSHGIASAGVRAPRLQDRALLLVSVLLALSQVRATMDTWGNFILRHPGFADFGSYYVYARMGLQSGWNHLYDLGVERQVWLALDGPRSIPWYPSVYPPPLSWVVAPFTLLPLPLAFACWGLLLSSLLLLAWYLVAPPSPPRARWTALALTLAVFPVLFALLLGQILIVELAAVALAWWWLRRGREVPAGLALAALVFKPQVAFLVPLALLIAGRRRAVLTWLGASLVIAAVALLTTGVDGLSVYAGRLARAASVAPEYVVPTQFTLQGFLGRGPLTTVLRVLLAGLALAVAYRHRKEGVEIPLAAALVGSLLATPYLHDQDLSALLLAGGLALQAGCDRWQRAILAGGYAVLQGVSYLGFGPWGAVLGPTLIAVEVAWLASCWRVTDLDARAGRPLLGQAASDSAA